MFILLLKLNVKISKKPDGSWITIQNTTYANKIMQPMDFAVSSGT